MELRYKRIKKRIGGLGMCVGVKSLTVADEVNKIFYSLFLILGVGKKHLTVAIRFYKPRQAEMAILDQTTKGAK